MTHITQLQGIGKIEGIPACNLKVGDITVWNYGYEEKIISIEFSKTGKTMICGIEYTWQGDIKRSKRKMKASRIVVVK